MATKDYDINYGWQYDCSPKYGRLKLYDRYLFVMYEWDYMDKQESARVQ